MPQPVLNTWSVTQIERSDTGAVTFHGGSLGHFTTFADCLDDSQTDEVWCVYTSEGGALMWGAHRTVAPIAARFLAGERFDERAQCPCD